jgi:hypothetical protein
MIAVVLPLTASYAHQDLEARLMLRSLEKNFQEDFRLIIVGRHVPLFIAPNTYEFVVTDDGRSKTGLKAVCDQLDSFVWTMDDLILVKPTTLADLKVRRWQEDMDRCSGLDEWGAFSKLYDYDKKAGAHYAGLLRSDDPLGGAGGKWWCRCWRTYDRFKELHPGRKHLNYACHLPHFYESDKLKDLAGLYEGFWKSEVVVENAYYNTYCEEWPERFFKPDWCGAYNKEQADAADWKDATFVNFNEAGFTDELKARLMKELPKRSRFEKPVG